jgi:hypothetical protein
MATPTLVKISELTAVTTPTDSDTLPVVQSGTTKKETRSQFVPYTFDTVTVTNASYTPSYKRQGIILDDDGDDTDIAITMAAALSAGQELAIYAADGGSTGHTVTLGGSQTFDGTNNIATFNAAGDYLEILVVSATVVIVRANNSVTFRT